MIDDNIKSISVNYQPSEVNLTAVTNPTILPEVNTFTDNLNVTIQHDPSTIVFYTTDGTVPSTSSNRYRDESLNISGDTTIRAIGFIQGVNQWSDVVTKTYQRLP